MSEGKYYIKIHRAQGYSIVAICDEEIIGKVFKKDEIVLNVSPYFYQGEKKDFEEILEIIKNADMIVATGRRIISKLIEIGLVHKDFALDVEGQHHVQIIKEVYS